jgi:hypothetical protein
MAERAGDPVALGRVVANQAVLARVAEGARPADGIGPWSPDGWVMRTHPDLTEALERAAPDHLRLVQGIASLVDDADRVYAVGWGTGGVWLRVPSGPAFDDAVGGGQAVTVDGLDGWLAIEAWRVDLGQWVRASAALTRDLVPGATDAADA